MSLLIPQLWLFIIQLTCCNLSRFNFLNRSIYKITMRQANLEGFSTDLQLQVLALAQKRVHPSRHSIMLRAIHCDRKALFSKDPKVLPPLPLFNIWELLLCLVHIATAYFLWCLTPVQCSISVRIVLTVHPPPSQPDTASNFRHLQFGLSFRGTENIIHTILLPWSLLFHSSILWRSTIRHMAYIESPQHQFHQIFRRLSTRWSCFYSSLLYCYSRLY